VQVLQVLIGISLGAVVTPETLRGVATYPLSVGMLIAATAAIGLAGMTYLRIVHRWDAVTAYLSSVPGGLSQVMVMAIELKADVRAVAVVQTIRIVIIAVCFPALLSAAGLVGHSERSLGGSFEVGQLGELAILVAVSTAMALIAHRVRFPGGLLFGSMLTSAALHGSGLLYVSLPWWLTLTVMVAFGAVGGSRFANTPARLLLHYAGAALGSFATALVITAIFTVALLQMLTMPAAEVMIAFAPGGVDAMLLLALALNLDPVYVGAHHLTRIFFVLLTMPIVVRRHARAARKPDDPTKSPQAPFQD
jgi:membrane AbrB-like protein